jgi:hypothetical protein
VWCWCSGPMAAAFSTSSSAIKRTPGAVFVTPRVCGDLTAAYASLCPDATALARASPFHVVTVLCCFRLHLGG